ncbi:MAG: TIGR03118 family protein [Terriglobia bacterium]
MQISPSKRLFLVILAILIVVFVLPQRTEAQSYTQQNLVSNSSAIPANTIDPNLVNPGGLVQGPATPFWVSDQVTNDLTLYRGNGTPVSLVVGIPTVPANGPANGPTGIVFNTNTTCSAAAGCPFALPPAKGSTSVSSLFISSNLNGQIAGWNPGSTSGAAQAVVEVNNNASGATYTGLAINEMGTLLYAANFTPTGGISVINNNWQPVNALNFTDPNLPAGFEPYNVEDQNVNGTEMVLVAYTPTHTVNINGHPVFLPDLGVGHGLVDEFTPSGTFVKELISGGNLDVPWGMAFAPAGWGAFGGDLLVGNFGNGEINAYDPMTGMWAGTLEDASGNPIMDGGLWALVFGNGGGGTDPNALYITAGITQPLQTEGLFAEIRPTPEPASVLLLASGLFILGFLAHRRRAAV